MASLQADARQKEELRQEGYRDFAAGIVKDQKDIQKGRLLRVNSSYYQQGVELARGRRRGQEVYLKLAEYENENPRPTDTDVDAYNEWLETGLASIQEELGVDPDELSEFELDSYVGALNELRQQDAARHLKHVDQALLAENAASFETGVMALGQKLQDGVISQDEFLGEYQELLTRGYAQGLNVSQSKRMAYQEALRVAEATDSPDLLKAIPDAAMDVALKSARDQDAERLSAEGNARYVRDLTSLVDQGKVLDESVIENDNRLTDGQKSSLRSLVRSTQRRLTGERARALSDAREAAAEEEAKLSFINLANDGLLHLQGDFEATLPTGENVKFSAKEAQAIGIQGAVENRLASLPEDQRTVPYQMQALADVLTDNRVQNYEPLQRTFGGIAVEATLEKMANGDVPPDVLETIEAAQHLPLAVLRDHLDEDDYEWYLNFRTAKALGGHGTAEAATVAAQQHRNPGMQTKQVLGRINGLPSELNVSNKKNGTVMNALVLQRAHQLLRTQGTVSRVKEALKQELKENFVEVNGSMVPRPDGMSKKDAEMTMKTFTKAYEEKYGLDNVILMYDREEKGFRALSNDGMDLRFAVDGVPDDMPTYFTMSDVVSWSENYIVANRKEGMTEEEALAEFRADRAAVERIREQKFEMTLPYGRKL